MKMKLTDLSVPILSLPDQTASAWLLRSLQTTSLCFLSTKPKYMNSGFVGQQNDQYTKIKYPRSIPTAWLAPAKNAENCS